MAPPFAAKLGPVVPVQAGGEIDGEITQDFEKAWE